jgi:hypothetical protein
VAQEGLMRRALGVVVVLGLALAPALVEAHIDHERPHIQSFQSGRSPLMTVTGKAAHVEMVSRLDPMTNAVTYDLDPSRARLASDYRAQPSDNSTSFVTVWELTRFVEYHDGNADGRYQPASDTVVRAWRLSAYEWNVTGPRSVLIGAQEARDVVWTGRLLGAPNLTLELDAAGAPFTDEGARVLPQDVILYLDAAGFPPRGSGDLYALEGTLRAPAGATVVHDVATNASQPNVTAGMLIQGSDRQSGLDWGAQATVDKAEQFVTLAVDEPQQDGTRAFRIDYPRFDKSLRQIFVASVEYVVPAVRGSPGVEMVVILAAIAGSAFARSKR